MLRFTGAYRIEPGDRPLTLLPGPTTGLILIESISPGDSKIRIGFGDTPLRRKCKIVSGVAWLVWLGSWIAAAAVKRRADADSLEGVAG